MLSPANQSGGLYQLIFPNGKSYIGITKRDVALRWCAHKSLAANLTNRTSVIGRATQKYGPENVQVRTLVISDSFNYLLEIEKQAIKVYGTLVPNGYNVSEGGRGSSGCKHTDEAKKKISAASKGHTFNVGRVRSAEFKAKVSAGLKGRPSPTKGKPSKNKGKKMPQISVALMKVTPEIKKKMLELRAAGVRLKDIAQAVGMSWRTTQAYCAEIRLTRSEVSNLTWETRRK